jgi:site-specific recombinase XerD
MKVATGSYWQTLKDEFMNFINTTIARAEHRKGYSRGMDLLIEYAASHNYGEYTPEIGFAFYEIEKEKDYHGHTTLDRRRAFIRQLNQHLFGNNFWRRRPRNVKKYNTKRQSQQCPEQFAQALKDFLDYLLKIGLKEITVERYLFGCTKMFCDFDEQGVKNLIDLGAKNLTLAFSHSNNKKYFVVHSRRLFAYLLSQNIVADDYSGVLPMLNKRKTIPSVYTQEEIKQVLDSVGRYTPSGKRDYAILVIGTRLGFRASDIRLLKFENVDFEHSTVSIVQLKTSVALQVPLPNEVSVALHDYIDNGREQSDEPTIFLDGYGHPLHSRAISLIASEYFKRSGIDFGHRRHSSHALRMSYASHLIEDEVPYEVVRYALGHANRESTRHYVKFDIKRLRSCALTVPPSSGLFAEYLKGGD